MELGLNNLGVKATLGSLNAIERASRAIPDSIFLPAVRSALENGGIEFPEGREFVLKIVAELRHQWPRFAPNVRKRFVENMFGHWMILAEDKRRFLRSYLNVVKTPKEMVISPTMRCNLKCTGCYSANYKKKDKIDEKQFDRILTEAKDLGIHFIVVSGGEPFIRDDLMKMFEKHSDLMFMVYTNATYIYQDKLAKDLAKLGNCMPAISVEGFSAETDKRRGKGVYDKVIGAMADLRDAGVIFGFSATPMRDNNELLVTDEFVDFYVKQGCFFGWYFSYMPVGRNPDLSLMPTPEQRKHRMDRIRQIRKDFPILAADFWCDGPLVGGCLSSGRNYFHVNAEGGVEPCVFHQFSVDNVLEKPLLECLNSEYFRHMRGRMMEIENRFTPCPVIDKPELLREAVEKFHPKPSQAGGTATVTKLASGLDEYSKQLHEIMDPIWEQEKEAAQGTRGRMGWLVDKLWGREGRA